MLSSLEMAVLLIIGLCVKGPPSCSGNMVYSSFKNRNFWYEYSTPPTTQYPDYEDYYYSSEATTTVDPGPYFVDANKNHSLIRTPLGATTFLPCRVADITNEQVSWFRKENGTLHVLTIGRETFSADERYSLAHKKPNNWRLRIRPTRELDNGTYLCQISTHPPTLLITNLRVIVPHVYLVDEDRREIGEKHYKPGSTIELHCIVTDYLLEFQDVLWRHGNKVITQDSDRGGISVKTNVGNGTVNSHLYLATATANDSGTYSCNVANLAIAKLSLHILNGEEPAAIQSASSSTLHWQGTLLLLLYTSLLTMMVSIVMGGTTGDVILSLRLLPENQ